MKYIAIDTESTFDPYLREAYQYIDPRNDRAREACRIITAASAMEFELDAEGRVSIGTIASWTAEDHSEADILTNLSAFLAGRAQHTVLSFGGASADLVRLSLACMAHDIALPSHLRRDAMGRWSRRHVDVSAAMSAGTGKHHHLAEIMLRLGLPVALMMDKACPEQPATAIEWDRLRQHCELDAMMTAIAFLAWRRIEGDAGLHIPEAMYAVIAGYLRQRPGCIAASALGRVAADMIARVGERRGQPA